MPERQPDFVDSNAKPTPLVRAAVMGLCPRCGSPGLFDGVVRFAPACRACALDFQSFNVGDGPAPFLIMLVGGIIVAAAAIVQVRFDPSLWVHLLLWVPLACVMVVGLLRVAKAALLITEHRRSAREGQMDGQ